MPPKSQTGMFTSQAVFLVTESAANTITFEKLETGLSVYDKVGWVIQRLEFSSPGTPALMNGTGDTQTAVLSMTNQLSALSFDDPAIFAYWQRARVDIGTAASGILVNEPFILDFSTMAGGGLLVLPNPIYLGVQGSGLTGPSTVRCRMYFTSIDMTDQDYFNLVQARQLLIST